jgi:hypothetical protein
MARQSMNVDHWIWLTDLVKGTEVTPQLVGLQILSAWITQSDCMLSSTSSALGQSLPLSVMF